MNTPELVSFLESKVALFAGFPRERLEVLAAGSRLVTFEPSEAVVEFGEEGRFMGVLLEGKAEVSVSDESGQRHVFHELSAGDIFGEMSLMTGDRTVADIIGITRCKALLIPQALFATQLITHPAAIRHLSKTISERSKALTVEERAQKLAVSALARSDDPYGFKLESELPMKLLVVNSGSSSLKYTLFDTVAPENRVRGVVERIGQERMLHKCGSAKGEIAEELPAGTHRDALQAMMKALTDKRIGALAAPSEVGAVGHRVVHGGEHFSNSVVIDDEVIRRIEELGQLAPLHNPVNLVGIREAKALLADVPHVAVFDTAFHHTLPAYAYLYGLPFEAYEKHKIRRYGFHGTSHRYVAMKAAQFLKRPMGSLEIVSCHLGNGASVCAVDHGRSVDTSMGLTPVEGLIMGTRAGDVDAGALVQLMRAEGLGPDQVDTLLNRSSGLKGLSGVSNDMREIEAAADEGHHRALLALKSFSYRVRKYVGAYAAAMGGIDVLVFTGGIGQGSAGVRTLATQGLEWMGIKLDDRKNREADGFSRVCDVSAADSAVKVLVVPTDEELMIARETLRTLDRGYIQEIISAQKNYPIPIEISAHHVHLAQREVDALFGPGHQLTPIGDLSQPGQFACKEQVTLVGPKGRIERVRVLGPTRKETQVEIAMTEQFKLGVHPPVRESGDLANTPGVTLEGTYGSVKLERGVICALRHVHMSPEDALRLGLRDKYVVRIHVEGERELTFGDVLVRVSPSYRLAMHLDTDEGNAANIRTGMIGHVDAIQSRSK